MENKISNLKQFITAGKAIFTVKNTETNNRFTFRVVKKTNDDGSFVFFVSVLTGQCNESSYSYIGIITQQNAFKRTKKSKVSEDTMSFKAFNWIWNNVMNNIPQNIELRHEGRCGRCGRKLTTPESIDRGFGPECIKHMQW